MKQKNAPRGCALARSRNMSQATARDARMCQGTSFFAAVKHMFGFEYFVKLMVML